MNSTFICGSVGLLVNKFCSWQLEAENVRSFGKQRGFESGPGFVYLSVEPKLFACQVVRLLWFSQVGNTKKTLSVGLNVWWITFAVDTQKHKMFSQSESSHQGGSESDPVSFMFLCSQRYLLVKLHIYCDFSKAGNTKPVLPNLSEGLNFW